MYVKCHMCNTGALQRDIFTDSEGQQVELCCSCCCALRMLYVKYHSAQAFMVGNAQHQSHSPSTRSCSAFNMYLTESRSPTWISCSPTNHVLAQRRCQQTDLRDCRGCRAHQHTCICCQVSGGEAIQSLVGPWLLRRTCRQ